MQEQVAEYKMHLKKCINAKTTESRSICNNIIFICNFALIFIFQSKDTIYDYRI